MQFLKKNWQSFAFPFILIAIIAFDNIVGLPWTLIFIKVFLISFFHALLVYKTKYIYNSEIYEYYVHLNAEYQKNHVLNPFLSSRFKNGLFFGNFVLGTIMTLLLDTEFNYAYQICLVLCVSSIIFIMDFLYEIFRTTKNTINFKNSNISLPLSLKGRIQRYMFTMAVNKLIQYGPLCIQAVKAVTTIVIATEVGFPTLIGGPNNIGPFTSLYVNSVEYPNVEVPLRTRCDIMYEHAYKGYQEDVAKGHIDHNPLKVRQNSIRSMSELTKMGLDLQLFK